jgi:SAM-dependent methyltransferase
MSKQEMDRTWMKKGAESRLSHKNPGEDITRDAALALLKDINGLILDLGAGEGQLESLLKPGVVVGLDENRKLLEFARMNLRPRMSFIPVVGSFFNIPFTKESFAGVVCLNTLENYPPYYVMRFLNAMLTLLEPGGRLLISYRGGASIRMRYWELRTRLYTSDMYQYRFNPRKWITRLDIGFEARIIPLLRQPAGWRRWLGTPADARALLVVDRLK